MTKKAYKNNPAVSDFDPAEILTDEKKIAEFINAELAGGDPKYIKKALAVAARARKMNGAQVAASAGLSRYGLYKALSPRGNPTLKTLNGIARIMGYRVAFVPAA